jgi:excisionase family DNA binding protein
MNSLAISEAPILPPKDKKPITDLGQFMRASSKHLQLKSEDGRGIELPAEVYDVLLTVVSAMQDGKAITVAPVNLLLTTQEAADFLGISRPSVVKLLEEQEIPYEQPGQGRHRKIRLSDLMDYQKRIRVERGSRLSTLISRAAEDGFYTEDVPDNFLEVLAEVRGSRKK